MSTFTETWTLPLAASQNIKNCLIQVQGPLVDILNSEDVNSTIILKLMACPGYEPREFERVNKSGLHQRDRMRDVFSIVMNQYALLHFISADFLLLNKYFFVFVGRSRQLRKPLICYVT